MRIEKIRHSLTLALMLAGLLGGIRRASAATIAEPGDLLLAFYDYNPTTQSYLNTNSYVVDLGPVATVTASSHTLALGSISTDLGNIFGSGWASDPNLTWGIVTYTTNGRNTTLYATAQEPTVGTQATAWGGPTFGSSNNSAAASAISTVGNQINNALTGNAGGLVYTASTNASVLAVEEGNSDTNSFVSFQPGPASGTSFGLFNGGIEGSGTNAGVSGVTKTALDLFQVTGTTGSYDGTFTINSSGQVAYSTSLPSAAPEPGRAALLLFSLGFVVTRRRRKTSAQ